MSPNTRAYLTRGLTPGLGPKRIGRGGARAGAAQTPPHGNLIVNAFSANAVDAGRNATAPLVTVGPDPECDLELNPRAMDDSFSCGTGVL